MLNAILRHVSDSVGDRGRGRVNDDCTAIQLNLAIVGRCQTKECFSQSTRGLGHAEPPVLLCFWLATLKKPRVPPLDG